MASDGEPPAIMDTTGNQVTTMIFDTVDPLLLAETLKHIRKLTFDANNYLMVNIADSSIVVPVDIQGDVIGLAKDSTLQSIYSKLDALVGRLTFDAENRLIVRAEPHRAKVTGSATSDGIATSYTIELDVSKLGRKLVVLKNGFDQNATVDVEVTPDGTEWVTLRSGISMATGAVVWGVLDRATMGLRVKVTTVTVPTSGTKFEVKVFGLQ